MATLAAERILVINVTGHRPDKLDNSYELTHPLSIQIGKALRSIILELSLYDKGVFGYDKVHLITGMALGVDTIFAKVGLKLKKEFPDVFFIEAAIPNREQERVWPKSSKEQYYQILAEVDLQTLVTDDMYKPKYMQIRNEYMVNQSNVVIAVWDKTEGGTKNCVDYALKVNRPVYQYNPRTEEITIHGTLPTPETVGKTTSQHHMQEEAAVAADNGAPIVEESTPIVVDDHYCLACDSKIKKTAVTVEYSELLKGYFCKKTCFNNYAYSYLQTRKLKA